VACDTLDDDGGFYPVYVMPGEDPRTKADEYRHKDMQQVWEVYSLSQDLEAQLQKQKNFNFD
jgi:hypothetical protein